jgi:hypothetical protein
MKADRGAFDSLQWEKAPVCDDFKVTSHGSAASEEFEKTTVQATHDGENLYVRFTAADKAIASQNALTPVAGKERWPKGDHIELWLSSGRDRYVFAFNASGARYDAKNLDRRWESKWKLKVRRKAGQWEAVAVIPMSAFKFAPGKETRFRWFCTREINHAGRAVKHGSYQGKPLYYRSFPIVIQSGGAS